MDDDATTEMSEGDARFLRDLSRLADMSEKLSEEIPKLSNSVRRKMRVITAVFVTIILVGMLGAYNIHLSRQSSKRFRETVTNSLCPIDKIIVDSLTPEVRAAQPPDKLAYYDKAVKAIDSAYSYLNCPTDPKVP